MAPQVPKLKPVLPEVLPKLVNRVQVPAKGVTPLHLDPEALHQILSGKGPQGALPWFEKSTKNSPAAPKSPKVRKLESDLAHHLSTFPGQSYPLDQCLGRFTSSKTQGPMGAELFEAGEF